MAVRTGPGRGARLCRKHRWTIPVAYDRDGGVGETDGVVVCPLLELVRRGGVVAQRLIGKHWAIAATWPPRSGAGGGQMSVSESERTPGGAIEPQLAAEFPGLELRWIACTRAAAQPARCASACAALSDRGRGARVVAMRTQPIAHAYRAFYRHTGLDPDVTRIPSEAGGAAPLLEGGFRSHGRIRDALLIALIETGSRSGRSARGRRSREPGDPHHAGRRAGR